MKTGKAQASLVAVKQGGQLKPVAGPYTRPGEAEGFARNLRKQYPGKVFKVITVKIQAQVKG